MKYLLYHYVPSLPAAVIFLLLFFISAILHTYQAVRRRSWFYIPLLVGAHLEWIGYIGRIMSNHQAPDYTLGPFVLQSVLLLMAPPLFAATIYMTLGRLVRACNAEHHLFIRASWLTRIFVCGDAFSLLIQSSGAGILSSGSPSSMSTGSNIVVAGLVIQVLFFFVFIAASVSFHLRMSEGSRSWRQATSVPWRKHMAALYAASLLILVRSIYRIVEYVQGNDGYLMGTEWFLYVFDSTLMLFVLVIFHAVHGAELKQYLLGAVSRRGHVHVHSGSEELSLEQGTRAQK